MKKEGEEAEVEIVKCRVQHRDLLVLKEKRRGYARRKIVRASRAPLLCKARECMKVDVLARY